MGVGASGEDRVRVKFGNSGVASKVLRTMELMESGWTEGSAVSGNQGVRATVVRPLGLGVLASATRSRAERSFLDLVSEEALGLCSCIVPRWHFENFQ